MSVDNGKGQGWSAVWVLHIEVGAGVGQRLRGVEGALARRKHQRRESALRRRQRCVGREVVAHVGKLQRRGTGVFGGAALDEKRDDGGVILGGGPHQR